MRTQLSEVCNAQVQHLRMARGHNDWMRYILHQVRDAFCCSPLSKSSIVMGVGHLLVSKNSFLAMSAGDVEGGGTQSRVILAKCPCEGSCFSGLGKCWMVLMHFNGPFFICWKP